MIFGVLDRAVNKVVSTYTGNRIRYTSPFADQNKYLHFEIEGENYPEAYSVDDFTYQPPAPLYSNAKKAQLADIQTEFHEFSVKFAAENSEILHNELLRKYAVYQADNNDPDGLNLLDAGAVAIFVQSKLNPLVDALKPLWEDIKMHYFWRITQHMAAIPREPLLASEARLAAYESELLTLVGA